MITIRRQDKTIRALVPLTPSKSITNRALIIRALCEEKFEIRNAATAKDSVILENYLTKLPSFIDVVDAGTPFRFLTAFLSIQDEIYCLTGNERMKKRPIGKLVDALVSIGADIDYQGDKGFPPIEIRGKKLKGGKISIDASESSQYISALLLIAPKLENGLKIELTGKINSRSYILMTLSLMQFFGIEIKSEGGFISIPPQEYTSMPFRVENDWSAAAFWYQMAALSDESEITLKGLFKQSLQGDAIIDSIMNHFGVNSHISGDNIIVTKQKEAAHTDFFEYDFSSSPDLVMPVAVLAAGLKIPAHFKGVKNLRIKESDRLNSLKTELEKAGSIVMIENDSLLIKPGASTPRYNFDVHDDHRIAMSLAGMALVNNEVSLNDHTVVEKSYPEFWEQLKEAGFICTFT
jgi:3-phosphoshikimate 1-carboxyvinyltransferase